MDLEKELEYYKKELLIQLSEREKELLELEALRNDYDELSKRYYAISSSKLGRITRKYWRIRNKFK